MSKLDDKLHNLKSDIPSVTSDFDNRVMAAMRATPPKRRFSWAKVGLISGSLIPVCTVALFIIMTNLPPKKSSENTGQSMNNNTGTTASEGAMEPGEGPVIDGETFAYQKSAAINGISVDHSETYYTHYDLTFATTKATLISEVNKYHTTYQTLLETPISDIMANETFFAEYSVAIVPFMFSSSELNIDLHQVSEDQTLAQTKFIFTINSPAECDADLRVFFYVVRLKKALYDIATNHHLSISVINTRDSDAGSYYYK